MAPPASKLSKLSAQLDALRKAAFIAKIDAAEAVVGTVLELLEDHQQRVDQLEAVVADLRRRALRG